MSRSPISQLIHVLDPYDGFDYQAYPEDVQGWGEISEIFAHAIITYRPKTILEVGTWKGRTAISMATILKHLGMEGEIICIDTFLGSIEHWLDPMYLKMLNQKNGYPTLYYQFLANVCHTGNQKIITPFPTTSDNAAQFFVHKGIHVDMVYIDAGHSYDDVLRDLNHYWPLIRQGGVLVGDDFSDDWPGVIQAVVDFAKANALPLRRYKDKYMFPK